MSILVYDLCTQIQTIVEEKNKLDKENDELKRKIAENNLNFLNMNNNPNNILYTIEPPDFYINTAKIDYNMINYGLIKSKEITQKINFINRSNNPCNKCRDQTLFCECDEILINNNLEESLPIILPLIKPILEQRTILKNNPCYLTEMCPCKLNINCNCNCPCKCVI